MTQRVNIQYSIDIEQLPTEVERLTNLAATKLQKASKTKLNKSGITIESVQIIGELRTLLAEIDHNLLDIENIMNGYIRFISTPAEPQTAEEEQDQRPVKEIYPDEEMMENLEAKIQSFKNSMSPGSTNDQNPIKKHSSPEQVARTNT